MSKQDRLMMSYEETEHHLKIIAGWLFFCCASVFCMILVGAITRLSGSGLSIVEWKPLMGAWPPLSEEEWRLVFEQYKGSPEYRDKNFWMGLADFKSIFFWEWFHRLLGRLIGVFYAVPFLFFLIKGWIPKGYKLALFGAFLLGGAQGFMGWYMVKSGLVDVPSVSHYRLTVHLSLALLIYGYMLWLGLSFWKRGRRVLSYVDEVLYGHGWVALGFLTLTIFWGAYTAGLDAGLVYNDHFPKMGATWVPEEMWLYEPVWVNFFENHAGVQFAHRWLAMITVCVVLSFVLHAWFRKRSEFCFLVLGVFVVLQLCLGIATLLSGVSLPIAVAHQGGAVIVLTLLLYCMHAVTFRLYKGY